MLAGIAISPPLAAPSDSATDRPPGQVRLRTIPTRPVGDAAPAGARTLPRTPGAPPAAVNRFRKSVRKSEVPAGAGAGRVTAHRPPGAATNAKSRSGRRN
ncbi:hypothetical protein GCM10009864_30740 [Streptomyces lunalinharesii]|uniref:Uncharacterized protein n=1 Tax=Streptomyces lunalinharesii TaxID=333384 RepID=A0ABN3RUT1_9ACTN